MTLLLMPKVLQMLSKSQLAGGKPVGYIQVQPRSWAKDYLEKIQLMVMAGLELGIPEFKSGTLTTQLHCLLNKYVSSIGKKH